MHKFEVIIDNEFAFELGVEESETEFYELLLKSPKVVEANGRMVVMGGTYKDHIFYDLNNVPVKTGGIIGISKFAFVIDGIVHLVQEIPTSSAMLVAAYSSDPSFRLVTNE